MNWFGGVRLQDHAEAVSDLGEQTRVAFDSAAGRRLVAPAACGTGDYTCALQPAMMPNSVVRKRSYDPN